MSEFPKDGSSAGGNYIAYTVDGRLNFNRAEKIGEQIFDNRWQRIHFEKSIIGVPTNSCLHIGASNMGLMSYQAAQALRWWFLANLETTRLGVSLCFETRLVEHEVKYSYSEKSVKEVDTITDMRKAKP